MWSKLAFRLLRNEKKIEILRSQGIMLGTRHRGLRRVFLYMLKDFFVEVTYLNDDVDMMTEGVETFSSLERLNNYLERDFRTA